MIPIQPGISQDVEALGALAMQFRATRNKDERRDVATRYYQTVQRLIASGSWHEMPPPEDQLPDDWMPQAFVDFWLRPTDRR